jgi:hypothetical protein
MRRVFEHTSHARVPAPAAASPRRPPRLDQSLHRGHTVREWTTTHLTLVKPRNRQHDVYAGVLRFIRKALAGEAAMGD